ncbi:MAG: hypothetical protein GX969_05505 [Firmicutes bacterium]|nr:hypothetical protein [Bacillota bacterium]
MSPRMSRVLSVAIITFLMAIAVSFVSKILLGSVGLILGLFILCLVISIGVVFDIIGTAATAVKERPLNAMASKKVYGAKHALRIARSADRVASFCNDIIGDMAGTVSGAIGAAVAIDVVVRMKSGYTGDTIVSTVIIGIVAAVTVGGKALGKNTAIHESERIVLTVGKILARLEDSVGITILPDRKVINRRKHPGSSKKPIEGDINSGKTS